MNIEVGEPGNILPLLRIALVRVPEDQHSNHSFAINLFNDLLKAITRSFYH